MNIPSPKKPVDKEHPTVNDILSYEVYSVTINRFMSAQEKKDKIELLKMQMDKQTKS